VDDRGASLTRVVGSVLVHNEDVYVEQAIRNVAPFCDRIHAVDHMSSDGTWETLRRLSAEYDHLDVRRARHARVSHEVLEQYCGTLTWILRVDGDELYDPGRLPALRESLDAGEHGRAFRVLGNVVHATEVDPGAGTASGYLSPPSRPISALYNFAAVETWNGSPQRLHAGHPHFAPGYDWSVVDPVYERFDWHESPLRCLHVCFVRRSSLDTDVSPRANLGELGLYRRSPLGALERFVRDAIGRPAGDPTLVEMRGRGSGWKLEKYRRGELVTVDATSFLATGAVA
jgi:glycosyltransferase involved in cell wall biosynthesis